MIREERRCMKRSLFLTRTFTALWLSLMSLWIWTEELYISVLFRHLICLSCFGREVMLTSRNSSPICVLHNLPHLLASACIWYPWAAWAWGEMLLQHAFTQQHALTQVQLPQDLWIGFLCNILLCDEYICHFSFMLLWLFNCLYIHILQSFLIAWSKLVKVLFKLFPS